MRIKYKGLPAALLLLGFTVFPASGASVPKAMDVAKSPLHKNYFEIPVAVVPRAGYNFKKRNQASPTMLKRSRWTPYCSICPTRGCWTR